MNSIGVDLDWINPKDLVTEYMIARYYFMNRGKVNVYRSSGGIGYHFRIKLDKPVDFIENLYWRVVLGDDPNRIKFSVKRIMTDPNGTDVLFDRKGETGRDIDITPILTPYVDPVMHDVMVLMSNNEDIEGIRKLASSVVSKLEDSGYIIKKRVPVLVVPIPEIGIREFSDLGGKLSKKYKLKFKIARALERGREFYFTLSNDTEDSLLRWGNWIRKKFGVSYWIQTITYSVIGGDSNETA